MNTETKELPVAFNITSGAETHLVRVVDTKTLYDASLIPTLKYTHIYCVSYLTPYHEKSAKIIQLESDDKNKTLEADVVIRLDGESTYTVVKSRYLGHVMGHAVPVPVTINKLLMTYQSTITDKIDEVSAERWKSPTADEIIERVKKVAEHDYHHNKGRIDLIGNQCFDEYEDPDPKHHECYGKYHGYDASMFYFYTGSLSEMYWACIVFTGGMAERHLFSRTRIETLSYVDKYMFLLRLAEIKRTIKNKAKET